MDAAGEVGLVAVAVVQGQTVQEDVVGDEDDGVAVEVVGSVQRLDGEVAPHDELSRKVDVVEGACQTEVAAGVARDVAEEALSEVVHEVDVGAVGADIEVDGVVDG